MLDLSAHFASQPLRYDHTFPSPFATSAETPLGDDSIRHGITRRKFLVGALLLARIETGMQEEAVVAGMDGRGIGMGGGSGVVLSGPWVVETIEGGWKCLITHSIGWLRNMGSGG